MLIKFLFKIVLAFCLNYCLESRFLYAYEINGDCSIPCTISIKKIIKNRICGFIFPREVKTPREILDGTSKISIIGLLHCAIFYFPVQIAYIVSIIIYFSNKQIADIIATITFKVMLIGFAVFGVAILLATLIDFLIKNLYKNRRKRN